MQGGCAFAGLFRAQRIALLPGQTLHPLRALRLLQAPETGGLFSHGFYGYEGCLCVWSMRGDSVTQVLTPRRVYEIRYMYGGCAGADACLADALRKGAIDVLPTMGVHGYVATEYSYLEKITRRRGRGGAERSIRFTEKQGGLCKHDTS